MTLQLPISKKEYESYLLNKPSLTNNIEDVVDYYASINLEHATAFLDQVEIAKKYIVDFPEAFQIIYLSSYIQRAC